MSRPTSAIKDQYLPSVDIDGNCCVCVCVCCDVVRLHLRCRVIDEHGGIVCRTENDRTNIVRLNELEIIKKTKEIKLNVCYNRKETKGDLRIGPCSR